MENGKWKISGNNTKDGFGNQPNPTLSNVSKPHNLKKTQSAQALPVLCRWCVATISNVGKPHNLKNAKCEGNFVPNEKAAPQQPQAVLCR